MGSGVVADGAKILGHIVIGENIMMVARAIIMKDVPVNSVAYGVNRHKPKETNYDLVFNQDMIHSEEIMKIDVIRIEEFNKSRI